VAWVPADPVAEALSAVPGVRAETVVPAGTDLPASAAEVEFYVPPFFPGQDSVAAMAHMPRLRVSTAEWVVGATIAAFRQFPYFAREQAEGRWSYRFTDTLAGKTVLILGYGSIGHAVERRLSGFEVQIRRVARSARDGVSPVADLPALLPEADVVILLAPVTAETTGMADAAFLARMKDGAMLVNAARGVLVVTDDLVAEVSSGRLFAVMDVTDPEPLGPGHPLWTLPNVLITPHIGASTPYSTRTALSFVAEQAERYLRGVPLLNVITGDY
jgi:phosphoglycerate dehydrogenase-like enzyme